MKYSVITAIRNGEKYISKLMASVFNQSYPHVEWIVQDGGSTDGTLDILRPHADRIKLVSEPDSGVYDAWNKALDRATGDWAIFLGADDFFVSRHAIAQCHRHLRVLGPETVMAFGALLRGHDGKIEYLLNRTLCQAYNGFLSDMGVPFPATFTRLPVLQKEKFDATYRIAGDFEFAARILTDSNLARLPVIVSFMEMGGLSGDANNPTLFEERGRVLLSQIASKARELVETRVRLMANKDNSLEEIPE